MVADAVAVPEKLKAVKAHTVASKVTSKRLARVFCLYVNLGVLVFVWLNMGLTLATEEIAMLVCEYKLC